MIVEQVASTDWLSARIPEGDDRSRDHRDYLVAVAHLDIALLVGSHHYVPSDEVDGPAFLLLQAMEGVGPHKPDDDAGHANDQI
jgi:hypothetical protein